MTNTVAEVLCGIRYLLYYTTEGFFLVIIISVTKLKRATNMSIIETGTILIWCQNIKKNPVMIVVWKIGSWGLFS